MLLLGHRVNLLLGGATACIGDPTGRMTERTTLSTDHIQENTNHLKTSVDSLFRNIQDTLKTSFQDKYYISNNRTWYSSINMIDFFQTIAPHMRVSSMLARDSVKSRLGSDTSSGLTLAEFSYQLFQAYDFAYLNKNYNCTVQLGGQDQWGNMTAGIDLIERLNEKKKEPVFVMTSPLLVDAQGRKLGKSISSGAIWLNASMTSPYDMYQFLLRTIDDSTVRSYLLRLTFLDLETIETIMKIHEKDKEQRYAQKIVAEQITRLCHGGSGLQDALEWTRIYFPSLETNLEKKDCKEKSNPNDQKTTEAEKTLLEERLPSSFSPHSLKLTCTEWSSISMIELLVRSQLALSRNEARRLVLAGGVYFNHKQRIVAANDRLMDYFGVDDVSTMQQQQPLILSVGRKRHVILELVID